MRFAATRLPPTHRSLGGLGWGANLLLRGVGVSLRERLLHLGHANLGAQAVEVLLRLGQERRQLFIPAIVGTPLGSGLNAWEMSSRGGFRSPGV